MYQNFTPHKGSVVFCCKHIPRADHRFHLLMIDVVPGTPRLLGIMPHGHQCTSMVRYWLPVLAISSCVCVLDIEFQVRQ